MLFFLFATGILLSVILLYFNARKYPSSIYLSLFFLTVSLYCFIEYVTLYSKSVSLVSLVFINFGFPTYLIGPLLYWYVRSILTDNSSLKRNDFWHFLPMLFFLLVSLPYMISPWQNKMEIAKKIVENPDFLWKNQAIVIYKIFPAIITFLSRPVLALGYTIGSAALIRRHYKLHRQMTTFSGQRFLVKWMTVLFGFTFLLVFSHLLLIVYAYTLQSTIVLYTLNIFQVLSGAGLFGLLVSPFFYPGILYGFPRIPDSGLNTTAREEKKETALNPRKNSFAFESDYLEYIQKKTEGFMVENTPYIQPDCNLASFSKLVEIPAHHLSYYFREVKKQSFNDYRNELRVNHAKSLIGEGKNKEYTIEAIGFLSGFTSRNAFFSVFKKVQGVTPGVYASNVRQYNEPDQTINHKKVSKEPFLE